MTLNPRSQMNFSTEQILKPNKRIASEKDINVTFAAVDSAAVLGVGYPVGFNESTGNHAPWMAPDASVSVVTLTSAASGDYDLTVNDATVTIPYDATAAEVEGFLRSLGVDASVALNAQIYTITFSGEAQIKVLPVVAADFTNITGGSPGIVTTDGTATNGTHNIRAFINPNDLSVGTKTGSVTLSRVTTLATATSLVPHGLITGLSLTMSGAANAAFNVTADITVTSPFTYTYAVADSGSTTDTGVYTTTNQEMVMVMAKGQIHATLPESLVAAADLTALRTALKKNLVERDIFVQGLAGRY